MNPPPAAAVRVRNVLALFIGVLGSLQLVGRIIENRTLAGIGAALAMSPAPKVFSDVEGLETFASDFELIYDTPTGERRLPITPELYQRLEGPYNRRNVYGAALSYAPRLPPPLWQAVYCFGLRPDGPLRREFGLPEGATRIRVEIRTKTRGRSDRWLLDPPC